MRTVEKHGAGEPGGTVENVKTVSMMSDASFKLPSKTDERKERLANGQCPSCGQQLYQLKPVEEACCLAQCFGKVVVQDTDGKGQQQLIKKVPLNIPQLVDRGQCVNCMHLSRVSDATCTTISEDDPTNIFPDPLSPLPSMNESMDRDASVKSKFSPKKHSSPSTSLEMIKNDLKGLAPPPFSVPGAVPVTPGVQRIPASPRRPVSSPSTAVYTGEYNDFGEKHGQGKLQWANGDSYQGTFVKDKRQGQGTLTFASGGEYVGEWFNNQMHGEGTRRYPNADIYVGSYAHGKREGEGRFYYANGDLFWGDWKNVSRLHCTLSMREHTCYLSLEFSDLTPFVPLFLIFYRTTWKDRVVTITTRANASKAPFT